MLAETNAIRCSNKPGHNYTRPVKTSIRSLKQEVVILQVKIPCGVGTDSEEHGTSIFRVEMRMEAAGSSIVLVVI